MGRLGEKHWNNLSWVGDLGRDSRLNDLTSAEVLGDSQTVLDDLDDLCVLLLFSVDEMKEGIEHGSFFKVLEPYKDLDANGADIGRKG